MLPECSPKTIMYPIGNYLSIFMDILSFRDSQLRINRDISLFTCILYIYMYRYIYMYVGIYIYIYTQIYIYIFKPRKEDHWQKGGCDRQGKSGKKNKIKLSQREEIETSFTCNFQARDDILMYELSVLREEWRIQRTG